MTGNGSAIRDQRPLMQISWPLSKGWWQLAQLKDYSMRTSHKSRIVSCYLYLGKKQITLLHVIPTMAFKSSQLTFYLAYLLAFYLSYLLAFYLTYLFGILSVISSDIQSGILSGMSSDILSCGISSDILSGISTWHSIWHIF